jgi:hypothetical protein
MAYFAILNNESVVNTIIADSKAIAEEVTGKTCVEYTTEPAEVNGFYRNGTFIKAQPYPSWVLNSDNIWEAPVSYPSIDSENPKYYLWDEESVSWVQI